MSVTDLLEQTGPVRIVYGEDSFAIDDQIQQWREIFEGGNFPEMNIERFYGEDRSADEIMTACQSMPAFSQGRLVIWKGHSKAQSTKMLGKLMPYFSKPNPSTLLVLVLAGAPDKRLKAIKLASKSGFLSEFGPLKESDAALWLTRRAGQTGVALDSSSSHHIVRALGPDRRALSEALEKLDLYAQGAPVDVPMIDQMIQPILDEDVWKLADLLAAQRLGDALGLMQLLLDDQRSGHDLVPGLAYRFRSLARLLGAQTAKVPQGQLARAAGVPPFEVRRSGHLLKKWTPKRMRMALEALHRADNRLKGGWGASERATMEALCLEVCSV